MVLRSSKADYKYLNFRFWVKNNLQTLIHQSIQWKRREISSAGYLIFAHFFTRPQERTELMIAHDILFILSSLF